MDLNWWITAVELPVLGALFLLVLRTRRDCERAIDEAVERADGETFRLREALATFKLEVAKTYVEIGTLRDVESRITRHMDDKFHSLQEDLRALRMALVGGPPRIPGEERR